MNFLSKQAWAVYERPISSIALEKIGSQVKIDMNFWLNWWMLFGDGGLVPSLQQLQILSLLSYFIFWD